MCVHSNSLCLFLSSLPVTFSYSLLLHECPPSQETLLLKYNHHRRRCHLVHRPSLTLPVTLVVGALHLRSTAPPLRSLQNGLIVVQKVRDNEEPAAHSRIEFLFFLFIVSFGRFELRLSCIICVCGLCSMLCSLFSSFLCSILGVCFAIFLCDRVGSGCSLFPPE